MEQSRLKIMIPVSIDEGYLDKTIRDILLELAGDKEVFGVSSGSHTGFSPATLKQCALMDKHKIVYDDSTSKEDATRLISDFFASKKKKKVEGE